MSTSRSMVHQVATSAELPARERYEHWLIPLLSDFEAASPSSYQRHDFRGRVTSLMTRTSELHHMQSDDFEGFCSGTRISSPGAEKLALVYVMQGCVFSQYKGDVDTVTQAGQFLLFDGHKPHRMRFQQPQFVQINLPRPYLQPLLSTRSTPSEVSRAVSESGLAQLLGMQMREFPVLSPRLSQHEQAGLLQSTEALAIRLLENACLDGQWRDDGHYRALYTAAIRYIRSNLDAVQMDSVSIAAALGCSRATLYRAFAAYNLNLAEHIRELRLQTLARLLQSPLGGQPIGQLAVRCGLYDTTNLSRLFRRRFGMTPREFRAAHQNPARLIGH